MARAPLLRSLSVLLLSSFILAACKKEIVLFSNRDERDGNEILMVLRVNGVKAQRLPGKDGKISITIADDDFVRAVEALKAADVPKAGKLTTTDLFKADSMFTTPAEERIRARYALEQELAASISLIDGVRDARVHLVIPTPNERRQATMPSAAVMVLCRPSFDQPAFADRVRTLVSNAVEGLGRDRVSVSLFTNTAALAAAEPEAKVTP